MTKWRIPLAVGVLVTAAVAVSRRLDASELGRSWAGRNARLVRMGAKVGGTYASTAARKTFASTERR